jgi:hypothetical protein
METAHNPASAEPGTSVSKNWHYKKLFNGKPQA